MNPIIRTFLEANGLRKDATEAEAWALWDEIVEAGELQVPGVDPGTRSAVTVPDPVVIPVAATAAGQENPLTAEDLQRAASDAVTADIARRNDIEDRLRSQNMLDHDNGRFARTLLADPTMTVDRASALILAELESRNPPIGGGAYGALELGMEARTKLRDAIQDGLLQRSGVVIESPAEGAREFRGYSLVEICRELAQAANIEIRGLGKIDLVGRVLASGSTSDFPLILSNLVNKNLLQAYQEWPATWRPFVAVGNANDFKDIHALSLSNGPDLKGLNENGEYETAVFSEKGESYRVITKGIKVPLTRQMIINDDLRAFARIPLLFGSAARRMESDAVYSLINVNGALADGVALFHADHNNLASPGAAFGLNPLSEGRTAMRSQKGMNGEPIDIIPAFLLTPVFMETDADILLTSAALPTVDMSSGVKNPSWVGKLTPISDPRLTGTAWYILAHPNQAPIIEVAWLEGEEQPYVEEMVDFNSDALVTKVRHDFGAGVVDHVGGYKNPGQ